MSTYLFNSVTLLGGLALFLFGMDVMGNAAQEIKEKGINFSEQAKAELSVLERAFEDIPDRTVSAYESFDRELALKVEPQEQVVDTLVREVKSRHVRRLRDGLCTVEYGFVLEAHEYLNALKAGQLEESTAYAERFARYKAQYAFPEEK